MRPRGWLKPPCESCSGDQIDPLNRRDEPVTLTRNRLDELRGSRIVTKGPTEIGDCLSQSVVGDVCARPERVENCSLVTECTRVVQEVEQKIEELGRQLDDGVVSNNAIAGRSAKNGPNWSWDRSRAEIVCRV